MLHFNRTTEYALLGLAYLAGRIDKKRYATASSPWTGVISYIPGE